MASLESAAFSASRRSLRTDFPHRADRRSVQKLLHRTPTDAEDRADLSANFVLRLLGEGHCPRFYHTCP